MLFKLLQLFSSNSNVDNSNCKHKWSLCFLHTFLPLNFRRICVLFLQGHGMARHENHPKSQKLFLAFHKSIFPLKQLKQSERQISAFIITISKLFLCTVRVTEHSHSNWVCLPSTSKRLHRLLRSYSIVIKLGENFCFTEVSGMTSLSWKFTFWTGNQIWVSVWKEEHKEKKNL